MGGLERLPARQRNALGSAFGLSCDVAPDRFLVGIAALRLITDAAAKQPVLCVVDDAHWLDQVSVDVLGFVARRLHADRVGMLFAVRDAEVGTEVFGDLLDLRLGARARKRTVETRAALTPQEHQIARLAGESASNRKIAARSPYAEAGTPALALRESDSSSASADQAKSSAPMPRP